MSSQKFLLTIEGFVSFHHSFVAQLIIDGPVSAFPIVVGCSLRNQNGLIFDVPVKILESPGKAIWHIKPLEWGNWHIGFGEDILGEVIFTLYSDSTFTNRLVDSDWQTFSAPYMIGSSVKSVESNEEFLDVWIGNRENVLRNITK